MKSNKKKYDWRARVAWTALSFPTRQGRIIIFLYFPVYYKKKMTHEHEGLHYEVSTLSKRSHLDESRVVFKNILIHTLIISVIEYLWSHK